MTYAYIRVSSNTQNIERQLDEIEKWELPKKNIFIDKQSGKDFDRKQYIKLKNKLKKGDLLLVKSIDRLGRNYEMIIKEWADISKTIEADIVVLDMPLLDTRVQPENLVGKFISDIVLQVLSFVAENERDNIKQRQKEGIRLAKERGVHMGRPKLVLSKKNEVIFEYFINKSITALEASKSLGISKSSFYKYLKSSFK